MKDINKLIGIPFKLGGTDFTGCDCRGICYLYHKHINGIEYPNTDGGRIIFRNPKNDFSRMESHLLKFSHHVSICDLDEGDIVIMKNMKTSGALGVCVDDKNILYVSKINGSCTAKINKLKDRILSAYRPFKYEIN